MRSSLLSIALCFMLTGWVCGQGNDRFYKLGPDSLPQEGVPKGEVTGPFTIPSQA